MYNGFIENTVHLSATFGARDRNVNFDQGSVSIRNSLLEKGYGETGILESMVGPNNMPIAI